MVGRWRDPQQPNFELEIAWDPNLRVHTMDRDDGEALEGHSFDVVEGALWCIFEAPSRGWICERGMRAVGDSLQVTTIYAERWHPGVASQADFDAQPDHCVAVPRVSDTEIDSLEDLEGAWWSPFAGLQFEFARIEGCWIARARDPWNEYVVEDLREVDGGLYFFVNQGDGFGESFWVVRSQRGETIAEQRFVSRFERCSS